MLRELIRELIQELKSRMKGFSSHREMQENAAKMSCVDSQVVELCSVESGDTGGVNSPD